MTKAEKEKIKAVQDKLFDLYKEYSKLRSRLDPIRFPGDYAQFGAHACSEAEYCLLILSDLVPREDPAMPHRKRLLPEA